MSANKTRLLFADDTDLLARARSGIMDRPEFDVVMAASTDEALQLAADAPPLGAVVLPAAGAIDGLQICRVVKASGRAIVILALPADDSGKRDACFAAGADDVLFAPVEAAEIAKRLERGATGFRAAPRADVELIVRLASPKGNAVVDATGMQISREAIQVTLPAGMPPPAVGLLFRVVFTLYEGGTLQVWARASTPDPACTILRFVGLTEPERRAIDYFVDFYLKRTGASPAATVSTNGNGAASAEELILSAEIPDEPKPASPSKPNATVPTVSDKNELVRLIAEAPLDAIADAAAHFANGRNAKLPPGFDSGRVRAWIPKLSPAETSALRGTTMYNSILGDLRDSAAARIRLIEMAVVLRDGGSTLDKQAAEQAVLGALTEAQQIHAALDNGFQELLKGGNTAAVRDLGPVKSGLLSACVDLKAALDRDVMGKDAPAPAPNAKVPRAPGATKYTMDPVAKAEPRAEKPTRESKDRSKVITPESGNAKRIFVGILLAGLLAGGIWSNRGIFGAPPRPPAFRPEFILFESNGVRVWMSSVDNEGTSITWIVDATVEDATPDAKAKLFEDLVTRSPGIKNVRLIDYRGNELASRAL